MYSSVIHPSFYRPETSLKQDIEEASDKSRELSFDIIANIVVKYIYSYFHFDVNRKISIEALEKLFSQLKQESAIFPTKDEIESQFANDKHSLSSRFHIERYPLEMALDIPATVEIFREVANRIIDSEQFSKKYIGIDLGSGIGILTLAQYIQARRNGFQEIQNTGIELRKESAVNSQNLHKEMQTGSIIQGNTTKEETYDFLARDAEITFITNETITDAEGEVWPKIKEGDPFLANMLTIFELKNISQKTQFFPQNVELMIKYLRKTTVHTMANPENQFLSRYINNCLEQDWLERILLRWYFGMRVDITVFTRIHISKIEVDGILRFQETIGDKVQELGIVSRLDTETLRPRWLRRSNLTEN